MKMSALCSIISAFMVLTATALPASSVAIAVTTSPAAGGNSSSSSGTIAASVLTLHTTVPYIPGMPPAPTALTVTIVNSYGSALTTSHAQGAGGPAASASASQGTIAAGATASFVAPWNWSGIVAINDAKYDITDNDGLIEGSFKWIQLYRRWVVDIDVSYVNGFTVPISCQCEGSTRTVGCAKDLWNISSCPRNDGQGACLNPLRNNSDVRVAMPFFQPCAGLAWTFPSDGAANSFGECQSGQVTCCVGTECRGGSDST